MVLTCRSFGFLHFVHLRRPLHPLSNAADAQMEKESAQGMEYSACSVIFAWEVGFVVGFPHEHRN